MRNQPIKKTGRFVLLLASILFIFSIYSPYKVKTFFYPYFKNIQHKLILYKTKDYNEVQTDHFIIRYAFDDSDIVELVAEAAEENYLETCKMFRYYPDSKSTIIIYDDGQELMENANLGSGKPPMGVYFASTIQILSPELWVFEEKDMRNIFLKEGPMVHEFTHLLVDDLANNNYPLWLTEGIALYQEYIQTGYEWGKDLNYPGQPYTVEQLTNEFHMLDEMLAYKRSFEIVKSIADERGFESLNKLVRALGEGKDLQQASIQVLGMPIEEMS